MSQAPVAAGPQTTRTEVEVAADTIAAIFGAKLLPMQRSTISELSMATRIPVAAIKAGWERREAGYWRPPSVYTCSDKPEGLPTTRQNQGNRKPSRKIPEHATEWICSRHDCPSEGAAQPIDQFQPRYESRRAGVKYVSRRTVCNACRKRDSRKHYLTVDQADTLGVLLRFVVKAGDACADTACPHCERPMLVGQEVESDTVAVHHAQCPAP